MHLGQMVNALVADVMAISGILGAGITQPHNNLHAVSLSLVMVAYPLGEHEPGNCNKPAQAPGTACYAPAIHDRHMPVRD